MTAGTRPLAGATGSAALSRAADEARVLSVAVAAWLGSILGLRSPDRSFLVALAAGLVAAALWAVTRTGSGRAIRASSTAGLVAVMSASLVFGLAAGRAGHVARAYEPLESGAVHAEAIIRGDPEPVGAAWRAEIQLLTGERIEATAFGSVSFELRQISVGDRVAIRGRIRPVGDRPWLKARHIVGRVALDEMVMVAPASGFNRLVNEVRAVIVDGSVSFDDRTRSLYTGLVIGDDRFQPLAQQARFRASGLSHLLAVSGQNVAFVLLVVRPLLLVAGHRLRLVLIVAVLGVFVAVTRAEPSVLRAATAAGVATWAMVTGRIGSGLRTLSVGVAGLVLVDPFLVAVVGFQLSVAASVGIIVISPPILARLPAPSARIPGTTALTQALALTVGAQIGVAPLLTHHFGPLPVASVPANLLAGWAAGAVMTLGLTVGPLSGLLHRARLETAAAVLQKPSRLLVEWIDHVARWAADLDLPRLGLSTIAGLSLLVIVVAVRPRSRPVGRSVIAGAALLAVLVTAGRTPPEPDRPTVVAEGLIHLPKVAQHDDRLSVLVALDPSPAVVDAALASGIDEVDVLITRRGDSRSARIIGALIEVLDVSSTLAPPNHRIRGARRLTGPIEITTDWGVVTVEPARSGSDLVVVLPPTVPPDATEVIDAGG